MTEDGQVYVNVESHMQASPVKVEATMLTYVPSKQHQRRTDRLTTERRAHAVVAQEVETGHDRHLVVAAERSRCRDDFTFSF